MVRPGPPRGRPPADGRPDRAEGGTPDVPGDARDRRAAAGGGHAPDALHGRHPPGHRVPLACEGRCRMRIGARTFREVWAIDWEFTAPPGANPRPICVVARELCSGRTVRLFGEELSRRPAPPYPIGDDVLLVAYYASAEIGCHLALGWGAPAMVL